MSYINVADAVTHKKHKLHHHATSSNVKHKKNRQLTHKKQYKGHKKNAGKVPADAPRKRTFDKSKYF